MLGLWAFVVLVPLALGLGREAGACHKDKRPKHGQEACTSMPPLFLQIPKLLSSRVPHVAEHSLPESTLRDDGSQVSAPGPPLTFWEASWLLGGGRGLELGQNFTGAKGLENVAIVYVSGRPDFNEALEEAVLRFAPMGKIFHTPGKVTGNFVAALEDAVVTFPSASWYYLADDDSFVHLERLALLAQSYDASTMQFIGHRDCAGTSCGYQHMKCRRQAMEGEDNPGWACGGPGVLISRPLATEMANQKCSTFYSVPPEPVCCGDVVLACCAYDVWEGLQVIDTPSFTPDNLPAKMARQGLVAVHHITPAVTRELGRAYNSHLPAK